ncbi:MAG: hypothetical protein AAF171_20980 [Cyanobacteria bacterium P01_A01_bin.116]
MSAISAQTDSQASYLKVLSISVAIATLSSTMKRFFNFSISVLCVSLFSGALHPLPMQGANEARGDTPQNRLRPASVLLQDEDTIVDGRYTTIDYTFSAKAGETVVVYWEALGSKVELQDAELEALAPMPYALPNLELKEQSSNHVAFHVLTTGEHCLSFVINGYDSRVSPVKEPRYFIRVRQASAVERLMAEATTLSHEYRENSVPSLVESALPLINRVIEQSPHQYPQPYALRVRLAAQLALSRGEFEGYSGQFWQRDLYAVFQAKPSEAQALILADLKAVVSNYEALAAVEEGFFAVPVDLEAWRQLALLLETGAPSAYLDDAFFNAILPTLIF